MAENETLDNATEQGAQKAPWTQLAGLWKNESKGGVKYLSGNLGGGKLIVYPNTKKAQGSKEPDFRLYIVDNPRKPKEEEASEKTEASDDFAE